MVYKKGEYVIWALERCCDLLKSRKYSLKVIVSNWRNALMNVVDKVCPKSNTLLFWYKKSMC